jgi:hypothetical protein
MKNASKIAAMIVLGLSTSCAMNKSNISEENVKPTASFAQFKGALDDNGVLVYDVFNKKTKEYVGSFYEKDEHYIKDCSSYCGFNDVTIDTVFENGKLSENYYIRQTQNNN